MPNVHVQRNDKIVHILFRTEGGMIVSVDGRGTPLSSFRVHAWCGRTMKMYLGGHNRFTQAHPTCVRCIGGLQCKDET